MADWPIVSENRRFIKHKNLMYIHAYIYYMYVCVCIYIYIYKPWWCVFFWFLLISTTHWLAMVRYHGQASKISVTETAPELEIFRNETWISRPRLFFDTLTASSMWCSSCFSEKNENIIHVCFCNVDADIRWYPTNQLENALTWQNIGPQYQPANKTYWTNTCRWPKVDHDFPQPSRTPWGGFWRGGATACVGMAVWNLRCSRWSRRNRSLVWKQKDLNPTSLEWWGHMAWINWIWGIIIIYEE